jgi:hypothetical protein
MAGNKSGVFGFILGRIASSAGKARVGVLAKQRLHPGCPGEQSACGRCTMLLFPAHCASLPTMTDPAKRLDCSLGANARWFGALPCACFDAQDRALAWNATFLRFFPRARRACPPRASPTATTCAASTRGVWALTRSSASTATSMQASRATACRNQPYCLRAPRAAAGRVPRCRCRRWGRLRLWCLQQGAAPGPRRARGAACRRTSGHCMPCSTAYPTG